MIETHRAHLAPIRLKSALAPAIALALFMTSCGSVYRSGMREYLQPGHELLELRIEQAITVQRRAMDRLLALQSTLNIQGRAHDGPPEAHRRLAQVRTDQLELAVWELRRSMLSVDDVVRTIRDVVANGASPRLTDIDAQLDRWRGLSDAAASELDSAVAAAQLRMARTFDDAISEGSTDIDVAEAFATAFDFVWDSIAAGRRLQDDVEDLPRDMTPPWMVLQAGEWSSD